MPLLSVRATEVKGFGEEKKPCFRSNQSTASLIIATCAPLAQWLSQNWLKERLPEIIAITSLISALGSPLADRYPLVSLL